MARINYDDYRTANGHDWTSYERARINNGELCERCGGFVNLLGEPAGHRVNCYSCCELDGDTGEVTHDDFIRCPKCGHLDRISDWDCDYGEEKYSEGEHAVSCGACEYTYTISTHVSYCYTSPSREPAAPVTARRQDEVDDA